MGIALRETKEARAATIKVRLGKLDNASETISRGLDEESRQLAAICRRPARTCALGSLECTSNAFRACSSMGGDDYHRWYSLGTELLDARGRASLNVT